MVIPIPKVTGREDVVAIGAVQAIGGVSRPDTYPY